MKLLLRYFNTAPVLLPLLGVFLIFLAAVEINNFWLDGAVYASAYMFRPILAIVYLVFWMAACFLRKWGMFGFIGTTVISWLITFFYSDTAYASHLFSLWLSPIPLNFLLASLLLLFYKKFNTTKTEVAKK